MSSTLEYRFSSDELIQMCVYKITNKINGKVYIGKTIGTAKNRWKSHCNKQRQGSKARHVSAIGRAILKYGESSFNFEVIDHAETSKSLTEKEVFWINHHKSYAPCGYNLVVNSETFGNFSSEETKSKRKAVKRDYSTYYFRVVTRNDGKVYPSLEEACKDCNISKPNLVHQLQGLVRVCRGYQFKYGVVSPWDIPPKRANPKAKKIIRCDGLVFESLRHACEECNISQGNLSNVLAGKRKSTGGYSFKYYTED